MSSGSTSGDGPAEKHAPTSRGSGRAARLRSDKVLGFVRNVHEDANADLKSMRGRASSCLKVDDPEVWPALQHGFGDQAAMTMFRLVLAA